MEMSLFNVHGGFPEGILRGLKLGFLTPDDYRKLASCESLEDVRTALDDTDYSGFLQDEPSPLEIGTIVMKTKQKLADEFEYLKAQSAEPLVSFLKFVQTDKMIDNVINLLQGALNNKPASELLAKADPMGWFEEMKTIPSLDLSQGYDDIYHTILIDTPVGGYFEQVLKELQEDGGKPMGRDTDVGALLTEQDLELLKNLLKKAWLEKFYAFVSGIGGKTGEIMGHILMSEADFRVLNISLNSLNTSLGSQEKLQCRNNLYPSVGYLYPEGTEKLCKAWNQTTLRAALEPYNLYRDLYDSVKSTYDTETKNKPKNSKSMEDMLFVETAKLYELAFDEQFHYGIYYAYAKLKEQEIRNIGWICNMIVMGKKEFAEDIIPLFAPRV